MSRDNEEEMCSLLTDYETRPSQEEEELYNILPGIIISGGFGNLDFQATMSREQLGKLLNSETYIPLDKEIYSVSISAPSNGTTISWETGGNVNSKLLKTVHPDWERAIDLSSLSLYNYS